MSWYNNIKKLEENRDAFFKNQLEVNLELLDTCLNRYWTAKKATDRSCFLSGKPDSTVKQRIRHELNCEDMEYKRMLVQGCIDGLSNYKQGLTLTTE